MLDAFDHLAAKTLTKVQTGPVGEGLQDYQELCLRPGSPSHRPQEHSERTVSSKAQRFRRQPGCGVVGQKDAFRMILHQTQGSLFAEIQRQTPDQRHKFRSD